MRVATSASGDVPLAIVELPSRPLGPRDVRVRVGAISVNPVDWKMRSGGPLRFAHRFIGPRGPLVIGVDFAGEVVEVGRRVVGLALGARVVGGTNFSRGQLGSYADEVVVRPDQCAVLPDTMSFEDAACIPVAGVTAWSALTEYARIKAGSRVLVLGASGGVGLAAIQLGKMLGATCYGVCSARNVALVERLGATAIDYGKSDALEQARAYGSYDLILNAVGTHTYPGDECRALLTAGGKHVLPVIGGRDLLPIAFLPNTHSILGKPSKRTLDPLVAAMARGEYQAVIEAKYPLAEAEAAHVRSKAGKVVGKLVLIP